MTIPEKAAKLAAKTMQLIEAERVRKGISMRSLSAAAGLVPTSYWYSVQHPEGVKAVTLFALNEAVRSFPEK